MEKCRTIKPIFFLFIVYTDASFNSLLLGWDLSKKKISVNNQRTPNKIESKKRYHIAASKVVSHQQSPK